MENKYFTPDIEDVTLDYTFEFCSLINPHTPEWVSMTLLKNNPYRFENSKGSLEIMQSNIEKGYVRVPYLTKEQIEAEGWRGSTTEGCMNGVCLYRKGDYTLGYKEEDRTMKIATFSSASHTVYNGECKDINTFRKLCKLLDI